MSIKSPANMSMLASVSRLVCFDNLRMMIVDAGRTSCPNVAGSDMLADNDGIPPALSEGYLSAVGEVGYADEPPGMVAPCLNTSDRKGGEVLVGLKWFREY